MLETMFGNAVVLWLGNRGHWVGVPVVFVALCFPQYPEAFTSSCAISVCGLGAFPARDIYSVL